MLTLNGRCCRLPAATRPIIARNLTAALAQEGVGKTRLGVSDTTALVAQLKARLDGMRTENPDASDVAQAAACDAIAAACIPRGPRQGDA